MVTYAGIGSPMFGRRDCCQRLSALTVCHRKGDSQGNRGFAVYADSTLLSSINIDSIERILSKIDKIEDVNCVVTTGGKIRISVNPLQPVARVFDGTGSYYINKIGKRISATARYHSDVPVITGHFDSVFQPKDLLPLVNYLSNDSAWNSLVTYIKAENPRNIILIPLIHGHVINIGDMNNLDNKFYRLTRAYKEVLPVKGWTTTTLCR